MLSIIAVLKHSGSLEQNKMTEQKLSDSTSQTYQSEKLQKSPREFGKAKQEYEVFNSKSISFFQ